MYKRQGLHLRIIPQFHNGDEDTWILCHTDLQAADGIGTHGVCGCRRRLGYRTHATTGLDSGDLVLLNPDVTCYTCRDRIYLALYGYNLALQRTAIT